MDYELLIEILDTYTMINADVLEDADKKRIQQQVVKLKIQSAFESKLKMTMDYYDSMVAELGTQSISNYGLDPEFNIGELLKELNDL